MTFQSTKFDMSNVMNKLRAIAEESAEQVNELDAGDQAGGKEIDTAGFTTTMSRLASIKDALPADQFSALKAGVRALYMNRRPNLQQMTALMSLLETVLAYIAQDNALFQRLKTDLSKDKTGTSPAAAAAPAGDQPAMAGAPASQGSVPQQPEMRGLK